MAESRVQYHVIPDMENEGDWRITRFEEVVGHEERHLYDVRFVNKDDAVVAASGMAKETHERWGQNSQLLVHNNNGTIAEERTYGDDPYLPKG